MKRFYCIIFTIFLISFISESAVAVEYRYAKNGFKYAYHSHSESSYQHAWCSAHKGIGLLLGGITNQASGLVGFYNAEIQTQTISFKLSIMPQKSTDSLKM